jgi:hypothetical protein
MLMAGDIEIIIPTIEIKNATASVGVTVTNTNNNITITMNQNNTTKYFSDYVEVRIPMDKIAGNKWTAVGRVNGTELMPAFYSVDDKEYVIRTKYSGTFKATAFSNNYADLNSTKVATERTALRQLATRGIKYSTTNNEVNPTAYVTRGDIATLLVKALDLRSGKASSYYDLSNVMTTYQAQGLLEAGIMSGTTSYYFNTYSSVNRTEAATIIANMYRHLNMDISKAYSGINTKFVDISSLSYEARQNIAILEQYKLVDSSKSSYFNPYQTLTRGQFAELLYNALVAAKVM